MIPMFNKAAELCVPYFKCVAWKCNSAQYTGDQYCVCTFSTTWIVPWTADTFRLWSSNTGNPERNRILNSISVCADGHSFYYNECFHLYDTELDRMGSQLRKSINKRTSEKDIAGCMDCLYHHAGHHLHYVWLRRSFK